MTGWATEECVRLFGGAIHGIFLDCARKTFSAEDARDAFIEDMEEHVEAAVDMDLRQWGLASDLIDFAAEIHAVDYGLIFDAEMERTPLEKDE